MSSAPVRRPTLLIVPLAAGPAIESPVPLRTAPNAPRAPTRTFRCASTAEPRILFPETPTQSDDDDASDGETRASTRLARLYARNITWAPRRAVPQTPPLSPAL
jgi:hypothetical protein